MSRLAPWASLPQIGLGPGSGLRVLLATAALLLEAAEPAPPSALGATAITTTLAPAAAAVSPSTATASPYPCERTRQQPRAAPSIQPSWNSASPATSTSDVPTV